jgi:molybdopterin-guanine dinucleotide biosynthesis protein A
MRRDQVTGLILAGGLGRRMSADGIGLDKGLQAFAGKPMVEHVIARLEPQVGELMLNANRNTDQYRRFGHRVVADAIEGFAGPLAGLHAGLGVCTTRYLATVPCDSPFLPTDLIQRLAQALAQNQAQVATARSGGQSHPVFMLVDQAVLPSLQDFLASGRRKIDTWYSSLPLVEVEFDDDEAFRNINTLEDLQRYEHATR